MAMIKNRRVQNNSKRDQILYAAVEMFLDKDFYQATVVEIAERAGVGKGTVYEYFPSKEDLFKECLACCVDSYLQSFMIHLSEKRSVKDTLLTIVTSHLKLLRDNRKRLHLLFNERPLHFQELQSWVLKSRQDLLQGVIALIAEGIRQNEVRPDLDLEMAGRLFLALNYVVMGGMVIMDNLEVNERQIQDLFEIYWNGIVYK